MISHTSKSIEALILLALLAVFVGGALAQSPRNSDLSAHSQPAYKPPATVKSAMIAPERFDDIPEYTGKCKFVQGTKYDKGRAIMYLEILHVQESKAQVINWYKTSLSSRGWLVNASTSTVGGYRKGSQNSVNITVNEIPLSDGARCELVVQAFRTK